MLSDASWPLRQGTYELDRVGDHKSIFKGSKEMFYVSVRHCQVCEALSY
jgi:hypothetical protein